MKRIKQSNNPTIKQFFLSALFAVATALAALASSAAVDWFADLPANAAPEVVGRRLTDQFLRTRPEQYCPPGYKGNGYHDEGYGSGVCVQYSVLSLWANAIEFASVTGDTNREERLVRLYGDFMPGGRKHKLCSRPYHVDDTIFGIVPLEVFLQNGDTRCKTQGLFYADTQWTPPCPQTVKTRHAAPANVQSNYWAMGYTPQTRLWIDDMYMIIALQSQAYRATGERKYIERAAKEMCFYLDELQLKDGKAKGLFYHAPDVPFVWGRGDGWMAAGMTLVLKYLPKDSEWRPRILAGYRLMMETLLEYQRPDGKWSQLIDEPDDPRNWAESSSSAMFAYAFITGVRHGWLKGRIYAPAAKKAWTALVASLDEYGNLPETCCGTGKKNDRPYYFDRIRCHGDPHGQAPMLWCAVALLEKDIRFAQIAPQPGAMPPDASPATVVSLNGSWAFRFSESARLESAKSDFAATDTMVVPGCWDVQPKWYMKRGTGSYRRAFTLDAPLRDGVLVVEGMGLRARFELDGRDLGTRVTPYARLEIPVGPLAAGEHTVFAAVDNVMSWPEVKLARPYYDFYFYGGFYHGVKLVEKRPRVFVKTVDYAARKIAVRVEDGVWRERTLPEARLWSPSEPNLTTIEVAGQKVRFGIRRIEAKKGKLYLNGKPLFLKGFNRHESTILEGAATTESTMLRDIQNLKSVGGNFIRGAHYQQCERFLDLCDEMGVLVWEESLGWGNGQGYTNGIFPPVEPEDGEFCRLQIGQTREMVRTSFNHPCVIISGFLNECNSSLPCVRNLVDRLAETIRREDSGHLVTFACNCIEDDVSCTNLDLIAFNAYPGTIPALPGTPEVLRRKVEKRFGSAIRLFRTRYPDKPILVSESGCGGMYGVHDPGAAPNTEEYQDEYLRDIMETLWENPECSGFCIWQMNDGRTRERFDDRTTSAMFGGSIAGCYDQLRRPKMSVKTVREFFSRR